MENFQYHMYTDIVFGKGAEKQVAKKVKEYGGTKVMLVYGGGSVKRNGVYDGAVEQMKAHGIEWVELSGVEPNPRIITVRKGVELCRANKLDGVLALGGGSVIDCSKSIAAGAFYDGDVWDFPSGFTVLTMAATGSEMDGTAVISDMETNQKLAFDAHVCLPAVSILDPSYTCSLPASQTAAGTADIMSHTFENYFSRIEDSFLADSLAEAILKACIHYGPKAIAQPDDYEARANIMWAAMVAQNNITGVGRAQDWGTHHMDNEIGILYGASHGAGLALLFPYWMEYAMKANGPELFVKFATERFRAS